jgi:hypothetical protein
MSRRAPRRSVPSFDPMPPELAAWAQVVDVSQLSDETANDAEDYLRKYRRLNWLARREFGFRLVSLIESQVSPPPPVAIAPLDIIATVVAERRRQLGIG